MFNPLRKLFPSAPQQPVFAAAGGAMAIPLVPSKFGGLTDPDLEPKPRLLTRVLHGMPGFLGGAGAVLAAKMATGALMTTVSAPALATVAAAAGVGAFVNQTVTYTRERHALLKQQATIPPVAGIEAMSVAGKISRELKAYGNELKTAHFWKGAATKGLIAGSLGASFGFAASNETVQKVSHLAMEKAGGLFRLAGEKTVNLSLLAKQKIESALANSDWKNPPKRLADMTSGNAHAGDMPKAADVKPAAEPTATKSLTQLSHPLEQVPVDPPTSLEKIRILMEVKGITSNVALDKMIARAESGDMQAVKDLAMGLNNGKLGLPMHKTLGMELLKIAAEGKNPQAIRDLAFLTKGSVATAVVDAPKVQKLVPSGVSADSREKAMAFVRALTGNAEGTQPAAAPAPTPAAPTPAAPLPTSEVVNRNADTLARAYAHVQQTAGQVHADPAAQFAHDYALNKSPSRLADEAGRCISALGDAAKRTIHTLCGIFKDTVTPDDHVLMQSADQSLSEKYSPSREQSTEKFTSEARRHFRDNDFIPAFLR